MYREGAELRRRPIQPRVGDANDTPATNPGNPGSKDGDFHLASPTFNTQPAGETELTHLEMVARGALEAVACRAFTDLEWERARPRLLEFVTILREWADQTKTGASRADKVVMIREPAPTNESGLDKAA